MVSKLTPTLTDSEKIKTMEDLFPGEKKYVDNVGNFLANNFKKIDGFDYRWSSLITSKPLLFEDVDYVRVRDFVNNECTKDEIEAYKSGKLRELYATFENLLVCNLEKYDRIMNFCTMVFLKYIRLSDSDCTNSFLEKIPYMFEMTPTQIWCCALSNDESTEWELNYAWKHTKKNPIKKYPLPGENKSLIELNYKTLYSNVIFAKFVEYAAYRVGVNGFFNVYQADVTPNKKLSMVCSKFTRTSTAIDDTQLETIADYIYEDSRVIDKLYFSLDKVLTRIFVEKERFGVYIFSDEFFIFTVNFKLKVIKKENGKITKDYLSNGYECFVAETNMFDSVKAQLDWARYELPHQYLYDKNVLISVLFSMINESYKEIKCIKRMNDSTYSEITFSGTFMSVYIHERFFLNGTVVHTNNKCLGKMNAAKYVVNRGYYIFGIKHDIDVMFARDFTKERIIKHYSNYCVPVIQHMNDVIMLHVKNKNDIIDVVCSGIINPLRLSNKDALYTIIKGNELNTRDVMNTMKQLSNNIADTNKNKLTYFKAIKGNE